MSSIYDNIEQPILPELKAYLKQAYRAYFCVGYFNLRGWRQQIDADIEQFERGDGKTCRLIVGCIVCPRRSYGRHWQSRLNQNGSLRENASAETSMAQEFRQQLTYEVSSGADQEGLRRLRSQLLAGKLQVKLFLRHTLHALGSRQRKSCATHFCPPMGWSS